MNVDAIEILHAFREADITDLKAYIQCMIADRVPWTFVNTLEERDVIDALRACVIIHILSGGKIVPREFQLEMTLSVLHGRDIVIAAGTGSGKTLCIIIPVLLRPDKLTIMDSFETTFVVRHSL